jgi:hypothetical protein
MIKLIHVLPSEYHISQDGVLRVFAELNNEQQEFMKQQNVTGVRLDDNSIIYMNTDEVSWVDPGLNGVKFIDLCDHVLLALSCSGSETERLSNALRNIA